MHSNKQKPLPLQSFIGKWYINITNFPIWLKGDKTNPTLSYSVANKNGIDGLIDRVMFVKNQTPKSFAGFDTPLDDSNRRFVWRGAGKLKLLQSHWEILYFAPDEQWGIIHFERTPFTPDGYDIVSRSTRLTPEVKSEILAVLARLGIGAELTEMEHA